MPVKSSPEVFNSRGKVMTTTQVDSTGSASTSGLNIRSIVDFFIQDVKAGVPLGLAVSTNLKQLTLSDPSQFSLLLLELLNFGLRTTSTELAVYVLAHFNPRKHFSRCLQEALATLFHQSPDHHQLPALLAELCSEPHLAPQSLLSALSLLVVEKLLCWVTASSYVSEDLMRIDMAQKLLADPSTARLLVQYAPSGVGLLSRQLRATLLGSQTGWTVCRDRLLDLFIALNRLRTHDGKGYVVNSVDDCNNVGCALNVRLLKPMDFKPEMEEEKDIDSVFDQKLPTLREGKLRRSTANAEEGFTNAENSEGKEVLLCDEEEAVAKKSHQSEDSEENMMSLQSVLKCENTVGSCVPNPGPLSPRFVDTYNEDLEKLREAVSKKRGQSEESEENMLSLQNALGSTARLTAVDQELDILGYLMDVKGESHPMADGFLIGRDPQCQLCLSSKTVSRKHAKIIRLEDGGPALQLLNPNSKVKNKVNGEMVEEDEMPLKQGDTIQISKDILVWENSEIGNSPGFVSCLEPKEETLEK